MSNNNAIKNDHTFKSKYVPIVEVVENGNGKFMLVIDNHVLGYDYATLSKACKKAYRYLNGQNR